ncbi:MAG: regulatory signaling modulator protein AmpE [Proteobacteria bacterium]|nr:regulatory signaling modulator protein AmpE [Pseudomonadota bacterium]
MSFIIIVLCLLLQRFNVFADWSYQIHWLSRHYHWIIQKVESVSQGHGLIGIIILLLPPLIITSLFFSLIYHFGGAILYAIFNFILLWFCIDGRVLINNLAISKEQLFILSYQRLFAVIFWFIFLGPIGLVLYSSTVALCNYLEGQEHLLLVNYAKKLKAILDWLPIRLLGLSYALMGHYGAVFKIWSTNWQELPSDSRLVVDYGSAALGVFPQDLENIPNEVIQIINRVLVLWLLVIAILSLFYWLTP